MPHDVLSISIDTHTGQVYPGPLRFTSDPVRFVRGYLPRADVPKVKKSWRLDHGWASA